VLNINHLKYLSFGRDPVYVKRHPPKKKKGLWMFASIIIVFSLSFPEAFLLSDEAGPYETLPECRQRSSVIIKDFVGGVIPVISIHGVCISVGTMVHSRSEDYWSTNH
jgi:hypothetical protein